MTFSLNVAKVFDKKDDIIESYIRCSDFPWIYYFRTIHNIKSNSYRRRQIFGIQEFFTSDFKGNCHKGYVKSVSESAHQYHFWLGCSKG